MGESEGAISKPMGASDPGEGCHINGGGSIRKRRWRKKECKE
jgi:hypothetical protein